MRPRSFRARLLAVILGSSAAAVLAVTLLVSLGERAALRSDYTERGLAQARIVAASFVAPLAFGDDVDAAETLEVLGADAGVRRAWVLDAEGSRFAAWARDGADPGPVPAGRPEPGRSVEADGGLLVAVPVGLDGDVLGAITIDLDLAPIADRLAQQARTALGALLVVLGVLTIVALRLQRRLSRPILDLADTTRRIRDGDDPSARATPSSIPELRDLAESLNAMLDQLDEHRRALADANERLEDRVRRRTDDLRRAVGRLESEIRVREGVEAELREAGRRAEAANEAKSAFLANMSHEIRTPMTAILGFADLLLDPACDETMGRDAAETIRRNGQHLISIINDILDISKIEAGRMRVEQVEVDLPELMRDTLELMQVRAESKAIELGIDVLGPVPRRIDTDPVRLRQIVVNLVGNAIKFTERGGVRIRLRVDPGAHGALEIAVRDTGIGVEPEAAARLFQPFAQADESMTRRFGGTGLGLAISRRLAELLGGGITLDSVPGEGSTFTVRIDPGPAAAGDLVDPGTFRRLIGGMEDAAAETSAETGDGTGAGPLSGRTILLVEDGPDNRRLIAHHLRRAGATVHLEEDGRAGVTAVLGPAAVGPDLVLMDMQMPIMDGYAATEHLRQHGWRGPIVALTAHAMSGDRERCLAAGCDDYLTKPVDREALVDRITRLLAVPRAA